jgi:hypothetical protein
MIGKEKAIKIIDNTTPFKEWSVSSQTRKANSQQLYGITRVFSTQKKVF